MSTLTALAPTGMLGYGIPEASLETAIEEFEIDYVACDSGSIDQGPDYLGRGLFLADRRMMKRDIRLLLRARERLDVPLLVGSAGGSGSAEHLDATAVLVREVADEEGYEFEMSRVYTDVDPELFEAKFERDEVSKLDFDADLAADDVAAAEKLVEQVGPEPFVEAIRAGVDVVLGGRCIDEAPFAAVPLDRGFDEGLTYHMAKILECGAMAAEPQSGSDCLLGTLRSDSFTVEPSNPDRVCTTRSVAAHTLYEKADPHTLHLPSGEVDVTAATFEQRSDRRVEVSGSAYTPSDRYSVLVEGVERVGYRTITPAGVRGEEATSRIDEIVEGALDTVRETVDVDEDEYELAIRRYGTDAVPLTPVESLDPGGELGIIVDVVGDTQEVANAVCGLVRSTLLHHSYEGRRAISGNLAIPYSPADVELGPTYEFSVHHLLDPVDPTAVYDATTEVVG